MTDYTIEKSPRKKLTKKQLAQLASFTDPGAILTSLAKENWTIQDAIRHLVSIAKGEEDDVKVSTRLNAIRYLNQLITDAMERDGLLFTATKKFVGEDGEEIRFSGHVVSSVLKEQKEQTTAAKLNGDSKIKEDTNEQRRSKHENGQREGGDGEGSGEDSLHTTKSPTGRETEDGHFDGISRERSNPSAKEGGGDFI